MYPKASQDLHFKFGLIMIINASINFPSGAKLIIVENFFPQELAKEINTLFKLPMNQWTAHDNFAHCPGRLNYDNAHPIKDAIDLYATQLQDVVGQAIDVKVEYINHSLWLDVPGYKIAPHKDTEGSGIAVQIYMGDPDVVWEMLGFCVYTEQQRALFETHYRINAGYICLHPHLINHGLNHTITPQFVRNSVYMRYSIK